MYFFIPTLNPSSIPTPEEKIIKNVMYTFLVLYLCIHIYKYTYLYIYTMIKHSFDHNLHTVFLLYFIFKTGEHFRTPQYAYNEFMNIVSILIDKFNQFIFIVISNMSAILLFLPSYF